MKTICKFVTSKIATQAPEHEIMVENLVKERNILAEEKKKLEVFKKEKNQVNLKVEKSQQQLYKEAQRLLEIEERLAQIKKDKSEIDPSHTRKAMNGLIELGALDSDSSAAFFTEFVSKLSAESLIETPEEVREVLASIFHILEFLPEQNQEEPFLYELERLLTSNERLDALLDFKEYFAVAKIFKLAYSKGFFDR